MLLNKINAGSDMDMESSAYVDHLVALVKEGKVKESLVDDAARRILKVKFELGLMIHTNIVMKIEN
jgi:beta-glucosidase